MFRPASNCLIRASSLRSLSRTSTSATRRFISTKPPAEKSRTWKSSAVRWGLAGAIVYYYNTITIFADEPASLHLSPEAQQEAETALTLESIKKLKQQRDATSSPLDAKTAEQTTIPEPSGGDVVPVSPEELDEEAGQQGAYNEETGEINWDCSCLGGMAHGPCGPEFKEAFSCFVYSKEEPKGVDCIEKFKGMQDCFRKYPEVYGAELEDDEEDGEPLPEGSSPVSEEGAASAPTPTPSSNPLMTRSDGEPGRGEMIVHVKPEHIPQETPSEPRESE